MGIIIAILVKNKFDYLLNILNVLCLSNLFSKEKVFKFQSQCRFHYKEFIVLHNYLRSLEAIVKKKCNVKI